MSLREGYKQTEAGEVPEHWEIRPLGDIATVSAGGTPSRTKGEYWNGDIPWITTSEVGFHRITHAEQFITKEGLDHSAAKLIPPGTLLLALYGQGKTRGKVGILEIEAATNQACAAISLHSAVSSSFVFHFLAGQYENIRRLSNNGNQENLNGSLVRSISILCPPLPEQRAIAEALSDVDGLLGALDRLIAKKRDLKQAAMQQLLTGQTRLPGFHGEWEMKRLGDHLKFLNNGANSRAELLREGHVRYLHYGDIHSAKGALLNPAAARMPFLPEAKAERLDRLINGDLIFADASEDLDGVGKSVELQNIGELQVVSGMHTIAVRFDKQVLADGYKTYLQFIPSFRNHLRRLAAGTKVYATSMAHIGSATVQLPGTNEQVAIAKILSDMDAELSALEQRREKTHAIKQGMMQELLTGKTRLV